MAVDGCLELTLPELSGRVRTARAQALATGPAPEVALARPVYARYGYDYWRQLPDGRIVLGGGRDLGGEAEWSCEAQTTATVQSYLDGLLDRLGVRAAITQALTELSKLSDPMHDLDDVADASDAAQRALASTVRR